VCPDAVLEVSASGYFNGLRREQSDHRGPAKGCSVEALQAWDAAVLAEDHVLHRHAERLQQRLDAVPSGAERADLAASRHGWRQSTTLTIGWPVSAW
jgi:predicted lipoprotein